jgi:hypothetical protein
MTFPQDGNPPGTDVENPVAGVVVFGAGPGEVGAAAAAAEAARVTAMEVATPIRSRAVKGGFIAFRARQGHPDTSA